MKLTCIYHSIGSDSSINKKKTDFLIPIYIKHTKNNQYPLVGRYNPISVINESLRDIIPRQSFYYKLVKGGLRIVPRRWVVIMERPPFSKIETVHPNINLQAKPQWANPPFEEMKVESEYIHAFLKSQYLVPFAFVNTEYAFIPIHSKLDATTQKQVINTDLQPYASKLYNLLDSEYRKRIKDSASMKTLADNFTYNNRLLPTNILLKKTQVMVVHNSIGSIVKSSVIKEPILLDNSLYYVILDDYDEAYYLCGVLNSQVMTNLVQMIGSTGSRGSLRNIHKNPYNFPIPKFTRAPLQLEITNLSKKLEHICSQIIQSVEIKNRSIKPRTVQKHIFKDTNYKEVLSKLDSLVTTLLSKI